MPRTQKLVGARLERTARGRVMTAMAEKRSNDYYLVVRTLRLAGLFFLVDGVSAITTELGVF